MNNKYFPYITFVIIYIIYLLLGYHVTVSNDSTTNMEQITALDLMSRSSHFSFHLLGIAFYFLFSVLLGFSPINSVEIMLSTISVLGVISLYIMILKWRRDKKLALLSALTYAFSTGVFRFSIQVEYLVLVPSLALVSMAFYAWEKPVLSGFAFALGLLTSPFIVLTVPAYFLFMDKKTIISKRNLFFLLGFFLIYLPISFFTFKTTVSGDWSYGIVFDFYIKSLLEINYLRIFSIWVYGYLRSFLFVIPFILWGLWVVFKSDKALFYIFIFLILFHLPAAIPEARYGGYQLTLYPFISILAAIGLMRAIGKSKTLAFVLFTLYFGFNTYIVLTERAFNRDLKETYVMLENDPAIPEGSFLFTYQASKPIRTLYAPKLKPVGMLSSYQEDRAANLPGYEKPSYQDIFNSNQPIYLLESGMSMPDDNIKLLFSSFVKNQGAKVKGFGLEKLKPYTEQGELELINGYPIDVYFFNK